MPATTMREIFPERTSTLGAVALADQAGAPAMDASNRGSAKGARDFT